MYQIIKCDFQENMIQVYWCNVNKYPKNKNSNLEKRHFLMFIAAIFISVQAIELQNFTFYIVNSFLINFQNYNHYNFDESLQFGD